MTTQFTTTVKPSGGDYTSLSAAVVGLANDITAADIKVFSISAYSTPTIAAGDTVLGQTSGATGVCVLVNATRTQILIKTIAVASFLSGEVVQKTLVPTVNITLSNNGDSPIIGIECYSMLDTTTVSITGYTTSSTNYIYIYTPLSERHDGKWNTNKYRLVVANNRAVWIRASFVIIDGLQIQNTSANKYSVVDYLAGSFDASNINILKNSIIKGDGSSNPQYGIAANDYIGQLNVYLFNNIIYNIGGTDIADANSRGIVTNGASINIYSCTIIGGGYGVTKAGGTLTTKNTYAGNATILCFRDGVTTTCASSDVTGSIGLQNIPVNTTNFINVTATTEDFHIPPGSALINVGTNTSGEASPLNFTTDIDGQTRPGQLIWDVGADQYSGCPIININFIVI